MVIKHNVEGYENFCDFMKNLKTNDQPIYVYFGGSKLPSGESWCDDCIRAAPVIEKVLEKADPESQFVYCQVGDRPTWKDSKCPFRTDPKTKLLVLPTILVWDSPKRLEGDQCEKEELLELLFTDDD